MKKKGLFKKIISVILLVATFTALGYGTIKIFGNKTKSVSSFAFDVGGLGEADGKHVERKDTIYTKEAIECQGLSVSPEFDSKVKYQIFWYNEDEIYFGHTEISDKKLTSNIPECARYCRIMILPNKLDENGKEIKDFKIKFYEVAGYANDLEIKVNKKQEYTPVDYYEEAEKRTAPNDYVVESINDSYNFYKDKYYHGNAGQIFTGGIKVENKCAVVKLDCSGVKTYQFYYNEKGYSRDMDIIFFDSNGKEIEVQRHDGIPGSSHFVYVPAGAVYIVFNLKEADIPVIVNKYLPK